MSRIRTIVIVTVVALAGCGREPRITTSSQEALRIYTEGVTQWDNFYYNEAKQSFEKALASDSTFAMAWCRLAMLDAATGNRPGAMDMMARALRYAPRATRREQLFIRMWHRQLEYDTKGAARAADSLLQLYPDEKEAYLFRGALYEETEKDYDAAIRCYQHAIVVDSNYTRAVMSLGYAYSSMGDQEKAVQEMQRYISLAPNVADPRASYADLLMRAGRYDDALTQYQKSLELKPDYWYSFQKIGTIYAVFGRLADAEKQYRRSFSLLPGSPQTEAIFLGATAQLDLARQNYAEAAAKFRRALLADTSSVGANYGLMYALAKMKKFTEAESLLARTTRELKHRNLSLSPAMLGLHIMKSRLLQDEGKIAEALAECDSAMEYSVPLTVAEVYRQRAEVELALGHFEPALDACEEALHTNPNLPAVLFTLTKVYHRKGDAAMTVEIGSRLLALWNDADPDFADHNELLRILGKRVTPAAAKSHQPESARPLPEEFAISRFLS